MAYIKEVDHGPNEVHFKGVLLSKDGSKKIETKKQTKFRDWKSIARYCAGEIIERGGKRIMVEDAEAIVKKVSVFSSKKLSKGQEELFHDTIGVESSDFIKVRFNRIAPKVIQKELETVVITSKNAVAALLHNFSAVELQFKQIFCVGRRTKKMIEQQIGPVVHAAKNAEALAFYLKDQLKSGQELTFFCGDLRRDELPDILSAHGVLVHEVEAYQAVYDPIQVDDAVEGLLFYSPSTVHSYLQENNKDKIAFCIGESTASVAREHFKEVHVAKVPTVESVIEQVNLYYAQN